MRFLFAILLISKGICAQSYQASSLALADLNLLGPQVLRVVNPANPLNPKQRVGLHTKIWPGLADLNEMGLSYGLSKNQKRFGILVHQWGPIKYREQLLALSFGLDLNTKMALGISLELQQKQIIEQDKEFDLGGNLFWNYHPHENWQWANRLQIQARPKAAKLGLESQMRFRGSDNLSLLFGLSLAQDNAGYGAIGLEYSLKNWLFLRQGFKLRQDPDYRAGLGFRWKAWLLDLGFQWQKALGPGQQISLSYCYL
ncbi:hypothetical protein [Croceimicrobium sp.]|uniref:hypothetical protein n=1 Tax=Croceimicrobium sp. TaxID=2828340 RepID=UPI003BAAB415